MYQNHKNSSSRAKGSASMNWLRAFALVVLVTGIAGPTRVAAYNVCSDPGAPCTHEKLTRLGLDLFLSRTNESAHPFAVEIAEYWRGSDGSPDIVTGVAIPDQYDPVYGNAGIGDGILTITHFWDPDVSLGAPQPFNTTMTGSLTLIQDDYPNAFQTALALWSRALGEYAAGNKSEAYQYLGMVTHFLGDQTIPTHVHGDTHGPDEDPLAGLPFDWDAFEEWMSVVDAPQADLSDAELADLQIPGIFQTTELPPLEDRLLWIFLNVNQVADYFASAGKGFGNLFFEVYGDDIHPSDPRVAGFAQGALQFAIDACSVEVNTDGEFGCPTTTDRVGDNQGVTATLSNDGDGDLSIIRKLSYLNGVRGIAALFALWEEAISNPILMVTVYAVIEPGSAQYDGDIGDNPEFYVGMVMGDNERSCAIDANGDCPDPAGAYLEDRHGSIRTNSDSGYRGGWPMPSNVTRRESSSDYFGNKEVIHPNFRFGRSYSCNETYERSCYVPGEDVVDITLSVWDQDDFPVLTSFNQPYSEDDAVDINGVAGETALKISVDLGAALEGWPAVTVPSRAETFYVGSTPDPATDGYIFTSGKDEHDDGEDWGQIDFWVSLIEPDPRPTTEPVADAGPDQTVEATSPLGATVVLSGNGYDADFDPFTFLWYDESTNGIISEQQSFSQTLPLGTYHFLLTVTDSTGDLGFDQVSVTVQDTTPPLVGDFPNIYTDATSLAGAVVDFDPPSVTDSVDPNPLVSCDWSSGFTFPTGLTVVSCGASDASGNESEFEFTVMVEDATPPTFVTMPTTVIKEISPPLTSAVVAYTFPTATDIVDPAPSVSCSAFSNSRFSLGSTIVSCSATDASGNVTQAQFTVIVRYFDIEPPIFASLPETVTTEATRWSGAKVAFTLPTALDNRDSNPNVSCSPPSGSQFSLGSTVVSCSATDADGNSTQAQLDANGDLTPGHLTVIVRDTTPPEFETDPTEVIEEPTSADGAMVNFTLPTATDLADREPVVVCFPASGSMFPLGSTVVSCSATDASGNVVQAESNSKGPTPGQLTVTVSDNTTGPRFVTAPITVFAEGNNRGFARRVEFPLPVAIGNVGDPAPVVTCSPASRSRFERGTHVVSCSATDVSGNVTQAHADSEGNLTAGQLTVIVHDRDTSPPSFVSPPTNVTVEATSPTGAVVAFASPTVTDNVDPAPVVSCSPASGSVFPIGSTIVSCTARDASGNVAQGEFTVTVQDTTAPTPAPTPSPEPEEPPVEIPDLSSGGNDDSGNVTTDLPLGETVNSDSNQVDSATGSSSENQDDSGTSGGGTTTPFMPGGFGSKTPAIGGSTVNTQGSDGAQDGEDEGSADEGDADEGNADNSSADDGGTDSGNAISSIKSDDVEIEIDALLTDPGVSDKALKKLNKSSKHLTKALDQLQKGDVRKGLKRMGRATRDLLKAEKEGVDVSYLVSLLVETSRAETQAAIDAAIAAGGKPKKINKAQKELVKAQKELDNGRPDKAIEHYRRAWEKARKAVK
jgi:hypothetical protein